MKSPNTLRYRLLALDLDGTIVDDHGELSPEARRLAQRLTAAGVRITVATGRRFRTALPFAGVLAAESLILHSGAVIRSPDGRTLYERHLADGAWRSVVSIMEECGLPPFVFVTNTGNEIDFLVCERSGDGRRYSKYLDRYEGHWKLVPSFDGVSSRRDGVVEVVAFADKDVLEACQERLIASLGDAVATYIVTIPAYGDTVLEVLPPGVSKWNALAWLLQQHDIDPAEVVAVGDDVNDRDMILRAGLGVAVSRAPKAVRDAADVVVGKGPSGLVAFLEKAFHLDA